MRRNKTLDIFQTFCFCKYDLLPFVISPLMLDTPAIQNAEDDGGYYVKL